MQDTRILPAGRTGRTEGGIPAKRPRMAREIIETVVLTLLIFFAVHFSVQPFDVEGPSMQPGLHTGEKVVVNLLAYDFGSPHRGDVIVFHPPTSSDPNLYYVKRVIAIPGDTINVTPDGVYVNGDRLTEPYISQTNAFGPVAEGTPVVVPPQKLGPNEYWVMGDNRDNSVDSRYFGPISRSSIIGKAEAVIWPVNTIEWLHDYSSVFAGIGKP